MKTKNTLRVSALTLATVLFCLPALTMASTMKDFGAGSIIIPMDVQHYQPLGTVGNNSSGTNNNNKDRGILEAYGLVYWLLGHEDEWGKKLQLKVYWIINDAKTSIDTPDFTITADTTAVDPTDPLKPHYVAAHYTHGTGGQDTSVDPPVAIAPTVTPFSNSASLMELQYLVGDSFNKMTYRGGPFIIDGPDAAEALQLIKDAVIPNTTTSMWKDVEMHISTVPFSAPVYKELFGIPPRIALMNNKETISNSDNAKSVLEPYMRMAGICEGNYNILTPYADIAGSGQVVNNTNGKVDLTKSKLMTASGKKAYNFLWAPHWVGHEDATYTQDSDADGKRNADEIVKVIREFVNQGGDLFAECASIQSFEHSPDGLFLTNIGIAHNGGTTNANDIIYNNVEAAYIQSDSIFTPETGHLKSWRPFQFGDSYSHSLVPVLTSPATPNNKNQPNDWSTSIYPDKVTNSHDSTYKANVIEYIEDTNGWDFYVGGYADNDNTKGYVVYLGGHAYHSGDPCGVDRADLTDCTSKNETCEMDTDGDQLTGIRYVLNTLLNLELVVEDEEFGRAGPVVDTEVVVSTTVNGDSITTTYHLVYHGSFVYPSYLGYFRKLRLKTKVEINGTPDPNFDPTLETPVIVWDTGVDSTHNLIPPGGSGNSDTGARQVYTSISSGGWQKIDFDATSILSLRPALSLPNPPTNLNDVTLTDEEEKVIERLRGRAWNSKHAAYEDPPHNRMGGIVHSVPAVATFNSRTGYVNVLVSGNWQLKTTTNGNVTTIDKREEVAYVGDVRGMLHAFRTSDGKELWAYIPNNQLGLLQYDRADTDINAPAYPAVDSSPNLVDVYVTNYDHDGDANTAAFTGWRTILTVTEGEGGNTAFALDVTNPDPDEIRVLWEKNNAGIGDNMGNAHRVSVGKLKLPLFQDSGGNSIDRSLVEWNGTKYVKKLIPSEEVTIIDFENLYVAFIATNFTEGEGDGIRVFAFDLLNGTPVWTQPFEQVNASNHNDIPGAVAAYDKNGDSYTDWLFVGDADGRMWQINAMDGANIHGTSTGTGTIFNTTTGLPEADGSNLQDTNFVDLNKDVPLFRTSGSDRPIAHTPAVVRNNRGEVVVIFGTGGYDRVTADAGNYQYVYAINATMLKSTPYNFNIGAGTAEWAYKLALGEKVYSSPIFADGWVYFLTATGTMNSQDPHADEDGTSNIYAVKLDNSDSHHTATDKSGATLYELDGKIYTVDKDGNLVEVDESGNTAGQNKKIGVVVRSWRNIQ